MSECDKSNAQVETSSKSNRRQPNAVNPIDISWDTPNVQNRIPARFPTTPNASNTIRRTNKIGWRAQVSLERAQSLFSPRISNQSSINQQRRPAQRVLDFGDDESPSVLDESLSTLDESLFALDGSYLDCVWLVEPIQAISKHSVNIDHGYNEASFTYKVFFCSATIKNVDKVVDNDVEALKRTDSCSISNYKHGEELIEIMTLSVFTVTLKPNIGPEKYEFSDDRLKYNVCCAAVLVNSNEVRRENKVCMLTAHIRYNSTKLTDLFRFKESIELYFGDFNESPSIYKAILIDITRRTNVVYFKELVYACDDNKFEITREVEFRVSARLENSFRRNFFSSPHQILLEDKSAEMMEIDSPSDLLNRSIEVQNHPSFRNERTSESKTSPNLSKSRANELSSTVPEFNSIDLEISSTNQSFPTDIECLVQNLSLMDDRSFNLTALEKISANQSCFNAPEGSVQNLSVLAEEKSADLTKNPSKLVYHHKKLVRFCYTINNVNAALNLNLNVKSNNPTLKFEPKELSVDGVIIWQNPNLGSN